MDAELNGLPAAKRQAVWRLAVYMVQIPVDVPLGGFFRVTDTSLNLRFHHRTDTGVIWGISVSDSAGVFRKAVGALSPATRLDEATALLGKPRAVRPFSDVLKDYFWETETLVYLARFFTEPFRDTVRSYRAGDQLELDVFVARHAPRGFLGPLLAEAEPGAASDRGAQRLADRQ